jgi:hypothetical protein
MSAIKEPLVIEITEDAYKQNSVYRPWDETKTSKIATSTDTSPMQQQRLNTLAAASRGLALGNAGMPA